ncbi:MAG TPA: preprotein translocase subunit YajC [Saprospiraceae bacterium]|jgi:preprotein translocase subunit YajC|nr:preprotein translocase subunit YajC [Saprospiraceae bacterium]HOJ91766.1 preprotein translocase subunit YajC [Saprospiraceae bacterium]HUN17921.1 preprotein translocase subunit YajC [Saprospiraceae bacterium]
MNTMTMILPWLLIFGVMYFFMLRPQIKKQKEQNNYLGNLKKGDQVVTGSGIIGKITKFEDGGVIELQVDSKTFIKILKSAVSKEASEALGTKNYIE